MEQTPEKKPRKLSYKALAVIGIGAVGGGLAFAGIAHASGNWDGCGKGKHMTEMFERFDANGDGEVSGTEIETTRQAMFIGADDNNDANLTIEEFEGLWLEHVRPRMVKKFQKIDKDGNGEITEAEFAKPIDRMAGWLDRNDDGVIKMKELKRKHFGHGDNDDDDKD